MNNQIIIPQGRFAADDAALAAKRAALKANSFQETKSASNQEPAMLYRAVAKIHQSASPKES